MDRNEEFNKLIERIKKLFALSKSPNRAEAAAALGKANELMLAYNISMGMVEDYENDPVTMKRVKCSGASKPWRLLLMTMIARANLCHAFGTGRSNYFLLLGREGNLITVSLMWDYLVKCVERIHARECPRQAKYQYRESFKMGIASGIADKIAEQMKSPLGSQEENALVVSLYQNEKRRIDEYVENQGWGVESEKIEANNRMAFAKGCIHGRQVNVNRQVDGRDQERIGG